MSAPTGMRGHLFTMEHKPDHDAHRDDGRRARPSGAIGRRRRVVLAARRRLGHGRPLRHARVRKPGAAPAGAARARAAHARRLQSGLRSDARTVRRRGAGGAADDLLQRRGKSLVQAKAAWTATRRYLQEMSQLTAENARRHAAAELTQAGAAHALEPLHGAWHFRGVTACACVGSRVLHYRNHARSCRVRFDPVPSASAIAEAHALDREVARRR